MKPTSRAKKIATLTLLTSFLNIAYAASGSVIPELPMATAEEAKIIHWEMPELGLSFLEIPELESAYINAAPVRRNDGIPVGELGKDGGKKSLIIDLAKEIENGEHGKYDSLLIVQNGKLLFESYYSRGRFDLPHPQSSATKSYTGLTLGRAMQLGYLQMDDLNKPLDYFLTGLNPEKFVEHAKDITLFEALTMTTGINLSEEAKEKMRVFPETLRGQREVQFLLENTDPITEESKQFSYSPGPEIVMQVIDAIVPKSAHEFIRDDFLGKLGITNYSWRTAASGMPESGWEVGMTSRDMTKIGLLAMNEGQWQGEQLIPKAFVKKATSRINKSGDDDIFGGGKDVSNQGYGFFWWGADLAYDGKKYFGSSAQGGGGMYIMLIRELDLLVVVTAHHGNDKTQQLIAERIIPAFSVF